MADKFNYNIYQQVYCLSMAANIASQHEGSEQTLQNAMKQSLNKVLPALTGEWALSWGPRVFKERNKDTPIGGPDNVWFAAIDETQKVCVIAIAGTAPHSWANLQQNLGIHKVVDFKAWVQRWSSHEIPKPEICNPDEDSGSTVGYCAEGTCLGAWIVLSNSSTEGDEQMRIDQYLSRLDESYHIVVTGHSLGGVLAPIVALGLRTGTQISNRNVNVLASAGVSPGNEKLAKDYAVAFPKTPESAEDYQVYNMDYYNEFDIVPQAWSTSSNDDRNLRNILGKILRFSESLEQWANWILLMAIRLSQSSGIRYAPLPGQKFTGPQLPDQIQSWNDFSDILSTQHVHAYWNEIGITRFLELFEQKFTLPESA